MVAARGTSLGLSLGRLFGEQERLLLEEGAGWKHLEVISHTEGLIL